MIFVLNNFAFSPWNIPHCTFLPFWTDNQDFLMDIHMSIGDMLHAALLVFHFVI